MKYYSEEQVKELLKEQRELCTKLPPPSNWEQSQNERIINAPAPELKGGFDRFIYPLDKQMIDLAILFNDGKIEKQKLADMFAYGQFIVDRLYENGDIRKPSSNKKKPKLFYIAVAGIYSGNMMYWWRFRGAGYSTDLAQAEKVNEKDALNICKDKQANGDIKFWAFPCNYIDSISQKGVDRQKLDAMKQLKN